MRRNAVGKRVLLSVAGLLIAAAAAEAQSVTLGAGANYHQGDLPSPCPTVSVTCAFGYWTTTGIHLIIPAGVNMTWANNTAMPAGSLTVTGTAQSNGRIALNPTFSRQNGNKTLVITVAGTFVAGEVANINGLMVANFGAPSSSVLAAETNSDVVTVGSLFSANSLTILGNPTVNSGSNQTISPPGPVTANNIVITDAATPGILASTDLRIKIPAGLNAVWDNTVSVVGISMSGGGAVSTSVPFANYEDGNKTVRLNVTTDFGSGSAVTVSGLAFAGIGADSGPVNLTVTTNGPTAAGRTGDQGTDIRTKTIVGVPSIDSLASQVFTKGDPATTAQQITITESPGTPKIDVANAIRLIIPAGFNMTWDTTVGSVTVTGTAQIAGNIAAAPSVVGQYSNGNRTVTIPVLAPFASNQTAIINGLRFTNFTGASATNRIGLDINSNGAADSLDSQTIAIGAPTISTGGNQIFQVGDPVTPANTITITDGTPSRTSAANDLRIKIPAGFNMEWDTARVDGATGITFGGSAVGAQTGTITYLTNQIARVNLLSPLGAGQTLTVSGMRFQNFSAPSTPNNIQLEVNNLGTNCNVAGTFVAVGGAPSISSAANQAFTVSDSSTAAALITITDANGFPSITAANGIRIKIPPAFPMEWNTVVTGAPPLVFGGSGAGHVTGAAVKVSYPDVKTALIILASDFAAGEVLTVNGLQFRNFTAPDPPANLDLFVDPVGSGVPDDKTIAIGRPTLSLNTQSFGTGDASTVLTPLTVTEDATVPRITSANGLTIRLPINAVLDLTWDQTITTLAQGISFTGTGAGHVTGATNVVSYTNSKTLVVALQSNFAAGETLIINGLKLTNFNSATGPGPLGLTVSASGNVCFITPNVLTIGVRPKLLSAVTADTNGNGSIDHLILTYDKNINGSTTSVTAGLGFSIVAPNYTIGAGSAAGAVVTLTLVEKGTADTDATPSINYDALVGNLQDLGGLGAGNTPVPLLAKDGAAPVAMSISKVDANGNGHLDSFTITFSEPLKAGMEDVTDWQVFDSNGTSDLLQGLTSIVIAGKSVTFNLADSFGTTGTPVYMYTPNINGLEIQDQVLPTANQALQQTNAALPNVVVGGDQAVGPSKVFLDASLSTDPNGQPLTFLWTPPPGITLNDLSSARPFFIGKAAGLYTFSVKVSNLLVSKTVTTNVTILNVPPGADAGSDQTLNPGQFFDLVALASSDANGQPPNLTFLWTQLPVNQGGGIPTPIGGANSIVAFGNAPFPSATIPTDNILKFRLDVSDGTNTTTTYTTLRINSAGAISPTANAGPDKVVFVNTPVQLDGSLSSNPSGGLLNYQWTTTLPPSQFTGATAVNPTFTPLLPGIYKFQLVVTNPATFLSSFPSTTTVLVHSPSNQAPVAAAHRILPGGETSVGDLVVLDGTGSADPEGAPLTYAWVQTVGPKLIVDDPSALRPSFTPVTPALYGFQLTVSDGVNLSLPAEVFLTVKGLPSDVEFHATLNFGAGIVAGHATGAFQLQGSTNNPVPGNNYYFYLEQLEGPAALIDANGNGPLNCCFAPLLTTPYNVTPSAAGTYRFRLSATTVFPELIRAYAEATVIVDMGGNTVPTANATSPSTAVAGETVTLTGSSPTGTNFYWTQVEGPPVTLSNSNASSPSVTPIAGGQYTFALTVSDGVSTSPPAFVVMTVTPAAGGAVAGRGGGGGCGFLGLEGLLLLPLIWAWSAIRSRRTAARNR